MEAVVAYPLAAEAAVAVGGYEAGEHNLLSTSSPAGWASILAILGFLFLVVTLGRGRGITGGVGQAFGFLLLVAAAEMPIHFLARAYSESRPDSAFAGGVGLDL